MANEELNLDVIDGSMSFHPSYALTISCGTVTIDPTASKVLLIWNRKLKIHQLPKGRKNIGEELLAAAVRETREETGVRAAPLTLKISTRSTPPADGKMEYKAGRKAEVTEGRFSTEPLGCCRYPDPQSSVPAEKIVFFYAAIADSTMPRGPRSPEDTEKHEEIWTPASEAPMMLRFRAEANAVRKAIEDARRSGYAMDR
jgi:ADP-ribose pyrophosphatase YjhB (NUDIX family)